MDIEKIKKYVQSEFDGFQIKKAVTAVKNGIKDNEQGRDLVMSDYLKTLTLYRQRFSLRKTHFLPLKRFLTCYGAKCH